MPASVGVELANSAHCTPSAQVATRRWVVEGMLDLAGFDPARGLSGERVVEPACGSGAFLGPLVERLARSAREHGTVLGEDQVLAVELDPELAAAARELVEARLVACGAGRRSARRLSLAWVRRADFLLDVPDDALAATLVVGNPPYVRPGGLDAALLDRYRAACRTMRGRADLYVGFFERGLRSLVPGGRLVYVCADRWMHNAYGQRLRAMVADGYRVEAVMEMHDADAFESVVQAYPAVVLISRPAVGPRPASAFFAQTTRRFGPDGMHRLVQWAAEGRSRRIVGEGFEAVRLGAFPVEAGFWPSGRVEDVERAAALPGSGLRTLGDPATGTRVGIGVATGADAVFVTTDPEACEPDRMLPLVAASDLAGGRLAWDGRWLVNPWDDAGRLVDLAAYPELRRYFAANEERLRARHVARKRPDQWYRTIDRLVPKLLESPKLLVPDLAARLEPVVDPGGLYPHHGLYWVASEVWDLECLGGWLLSEAAHRVVGTYGVRMRGGTLRCQAQYLRAVPIPAFEDLSRAAAEALRRAFRERDRGLASEVADGLLARAGSAQR